MAALCLTGMALAQASSTAPAQDGPISAIDWLSDVIQTPPQRPTDNSGIPDSAGTERIDVAPLPGLVADGVGLVPARVAGLPDGFWGASPADRLADLLRQQGPPENRAARQLFKRIMVAELEPPTAGTGAQNAVFLARVDMLLAMGALENARALVERAGVTSDAQIFRRWFDISLLMETEERACAAMRASPDVSPTFSARIFCLARNRDWPAAALSLETARALGALEEEQADLMARFLDPELFEGEAFPPLSLPISPLDYRMRAALGEAPAPASLPVAFNYARLSPNQGWKQRIEAAERLARAGGITPRELFALYQERKPAASGGVWDRVAALQRFDIALLANDTARIEATLPSAARALRSAGLFEVFAEGYGARLGHLMLGGAARDVADDMILHSAEAETHASAIAARSGPRLGLAAALARGQSAPHLAKTPLERAVSDAFSAPGAAPLPQPYDRLIAQDRLGEATLLALQAAGKAAPDPDDAQTGLSVLRALGFERAAREIAVSLVLSMDAP